MRASEAETLRRYGLNGALTDRKIVRIGCPLAVENLKVLMVARVGHQAFAQFWRLDTDLKVEPELWHRIRNR